MVSLIPSTQSLLYNHMSFFTDLRSFSDPVFCQTKNSVYDYLCENKRFLKFKKMIEKADAVPFYNESKLTLFIIEDCFLENLNIEKEDINSCRKILNSLTLKTVLTKEYLKSSPLSFFSNKMGDRILVENSNNETFLNNSNVIKEFDINLQNGVIHVIKPI